MDKLKRSLSFRKKKEHVPECSKPHQWQEDERKVREGTCSFQVRYLGCIEVFESRGMQVCEEAVKALKSKGHRSVWSRMSLRRKKKDKKDKQCKGKYQRAILYVSGDALRVVDEISKGLIVDQTIEKVSFCAPDRNHEKGFAYICRDGTTRRWMCHGFLALKESGERLSHAVGCAFAICLEKKQKREKDSVTVQFNDKGTCFARTGSFRQATLTERLQDPQSTILSEPVPDAAPTDTQYAVQRPHATQDMLVRQGSFRGFQKLSETSPFKRQLSLRLNELPSTLERTQEARQNGGVHNGLAPLHELDTECTASSPIPEASPSKENQDSIAQMCAELTQGLSQLTSDDPFANAPTSIAMAAVPPPASPSHSTQSGYTTTVQGREVQLPNPIRQMNPWGGSGPPPPGSGPLPARSQGSPLAGVTPPPAPPRNPVQRKTSDAEMWLHSTAHVVASPRQSDPFGSVPGMTNGVSNASPYAYPPGPPTTASPYATAPGPPAYAPPPGPPHQPISAAYIPPRTHQRPPPLGQLRSQSQGDMWAQHHGRPEHAPFQSPQSANPPPAPWQPPAHTGPDPFDAAWAAKSNQTNPFGPADPVTKTFEVKL